MNEICYFCSFYNLQFKTPTAIYGICISKESKHCNNYVRGNKEGCDLFTFTDELGIEYTNQAIDVEIDIDELKTLLKEIKELLLKIESRLK